MSVSNATVSELLFEAVKTSASARVVGCDPTTLDFEARWAVWELLRDLPIYRKTEAITPVVGQTGYALTLAPAEHAVLVLAAGYGDAPLAIKLLPTNAIEISPAPTAGALQTIRVEYSVTVLPLASVTLEYAMLTNQGPALPIPPAGLPTALDPYAAAPYVMPQCITAYLDVLAELLLARLFSMPDKPWTNPAAATRHRQAYVKCKQEARWSDQRSGVVGSSRVRAPRFA